MAQPQSLAAMTEALHAIHEQRAGSMTETERKEIYQLISAAASALSDDDRRKGAVATAAAAAAKTAEAERFAKRSAWLWSRRTPARESTWARSGT